MPHGLGETLQPAPFISPEQHGLKQLNETQLVERLLLADPEWTDEQRLMVAGAYGFAALLHTDDMHRDQSYTYHLLRNANRIASYLHVTDPEVLAAALLHDSVEDHADKIVRFAVAGTFTETPIVTDPVVARQHAFEHIATMFSPRVSQIVEGMSNPLPEPSSELTRDQKLHIYVEHIREEIEDVDVWMNKLVDWSDNGVGIIHSDFPEDSARYRNFQHKYGLVLPVLEARYYRDDIQMLLDPVAHSNVVQLFVVARERLAA